MFNQIECSMGEKKKGERNYLDTADEYAKNVFKLNQTINKNEL